MTTQQIKQHDRYKHGQFALVLSIVFTLFFLYQAVINQTTIYTLLSLAFLFESIIQQLLLKRLGKEGVSPATHSKLTRIYTLLQVFSLATGNVFTASFAFRLRQEKETISYTLMTYILIADIFLVALTALNIFKPYVTNNFLIILIGLIALTVIDGLLMHYLKADLTETKQVTTRMRVLMIFLVITALTGNVLRLLLSYQLYIHYIQTDVSKREQSSQFWQKITRSFTSMLGLLFIVVIFSLSWTSTFTFVESFAVENNYQTLLLEPSLTHPFGTDNFGRDVYSRVVRGGVISLSIGVLTTLIPMVIGGILGAISGYFHPLVDQTVMRILDALYAIPGILLAIAIIAAFGSNTTNLVIALSIGAIPMFARTMRANVLMIKHLEYIEASRAIGESEWKILFKHIIPNALAPMIVRATLAIGTAVIATSSLSFLGLGVEPHVPEWGNVLRVGSTYLETEPYLAIFPGLAIILLVLSFNFLGDGVRDALDPKMH